MSNIDEYDSVENDLEDSNIEGTESSDFEDEVDANTETREFESELEQFLDA